MQQGKSGDLCLLASDWTVRLHGRVLVQGIDLALTAQASLAVLGDAGSGKSSLLRLLAGAMTLHPQLQQTGSIHYLGAPLTQDNAPPMVGLSAKVLVATTFDALLACACLKAARTRADWMTWLDARMTGWGFGELRDHWDQRVVTLSPLHQRVVAIASEALAQPPLLLIDDLTKGLSEYDSFVLLDFVRELRTEMGVIVALNNPREARMLSGPMILLDRGAIVESGELDSFLDDPDTQVGVEFLYSGTIDFLIELGPDDTEQPPAANSTLTIPGSLGEPSSQPDPFNPPHALGLSNKLPPLAGEGHVPPSGPTRRYLSEHVPASFGPPGFYWLVPGVLAGMPMPGLVNGLAHDLAALKRCRVSSLISLSQEPVSADTLAQLGIRALHLAGPDHEIPSPAQLRMMVLAMSRRIAQGHCVTVHCKSGDARTGVLLAAYLMAQGAALEAAVALVEACNPAFKATAAQRAVLAHTQPGSDVQQRKMA